MAGQELRISDIRGALTREEPDVYVTFRLGNEHAETPVIKDASERVEWPEPVTVAPADETRSSKATPVDELVVCFSRPSLRLLRPGVFMTASVRSPLLCRCRCICG